MLSSRLFLISSVRPAAGHACASSCLSAASSHSSPSPPNTTHHRSYTPYASKLRHHRLYHNTAIAAHRSQLRRRGSRVSRRLFSSQCRLCAESGSGPASKGPKIPPPPRPRLVVPPPPYASGPRVPPPKGVVPPLPLKPGMSPLRAPVPGLKPKPIKPAKPATQPSVPQGRPVGNGLYIDNSVAAMFAPDLVRDAQAKKFQDAVNLVKREAEQRDLKVQWEKIYAMIECREKIEDYLPAIGRFIKSTRDVLDELEQNIAERKNQAVADRIMQRLKESMLKARTEKEEKDAAFLAKLEQQQRERRRVLDQYMENAALVAKKAAVRHLLYAQLQQQSTDWINNCSDLIDYLRSQVIQGRTGKDFDKFRALHNKITSALAKSSDAAHQWRRFFKISLRISGRLSHDPEAWRLSHVGLHSQDAINEYMSTSVSWAIDQRALAMSLLESTDRSSTKRRVQLKRSLLAIQKELGGLEHSFKMCGFAKPAAMRLELVKVHEYLLQRPESLIWKQLEVLGPFMVLLHQVGAGMSSARRLAMQLQEERKKHLRRGRYMKDRETRSTESEGSWIGRQFYTFFYQSRDFMKEFGLCFDELVELSWERLKFERNFPEYAALMSDSSRASNAVALSNTQNNGVPTTITKERNGMLKAWISAMYALSLPVGSQELAFPGPPAPGTGKTRARAKPVRPAATATATPRNAHRTSVRTASSRVLQEQQQQKQKQQYLSLLETHLTDEPKPSTPVSEKKPMYPRQAARLAGKLHQRVPVAAGKTPLRHASAAAAKPATEKTETATAKVTKSTITKKKPATATETVAHTVPPQRARTEAKSKVATPVETSGAVTNRATSKPPTVAKDKGVTNKTIERKKTVIKSSQEKMLAQKTPSPSPSPSPSSSHLQAQRKPPSLATPPPPRPLPQVPQQQPAQLPKFSHRNYRTPDGTPIPIHYCTNLVDAERVCATILTELNNRVVLGYEPVVGFDLEWKVNANSLSPLTDRVSMIQLATPERIAIVHIARFVKRSQPNDVVPPSFRMLMESSTILKVGVVIKNDCTKLLNVLGVNTNNLYELSLLYRLAKYHGTDKLSELKSRRPVALATQVLDFMGVVLDKDNDIRMGNWAGRLNMAQTDYAASDAYVNLKLFEVLESRRLRLDGSPERPSMTGTPQKKAAPAELPPSTVSTVVQKSKSTVTTTNAKKPATTQKVTQSKSVHVSEETSAGGKAKFEAGVAEAEVSSSNPTSGSPYSRVKEFPGGIPVISFHKDYDSNKENQEPSPGESFKKPTTAIPSTTKGRRRPSVTGATTAPYPKPMPPGFRRGTSQNDSRSWGQS